jgi:hypothetical protein
VPLASDGGSREAKRQVCRQEVSCSASDAVRAEELARH